MPISRAARMIAESIDSDRLHLAQEAQSIADTATRLAKDVDKRIACGDANRLAQDVQQFVLRAARLKAMQETFELCAADQPTP
jgi:hypothetical protein